MPIVLFANWADLRDELVAHVVDEVRRSNGADMHILTTTILEMIMSNQENLDARADLLATQFAEVTAALEELRAANDALDTPLDFARMDAALGVVAATVPDAPPVEDPAPEDPAPVEG